METKELERLKELVLPHEISWVGTIETVYLKKIIEIAECEANHLDTLVSLRLSVKEIEVMKMMLTYGASEPSDVDFETLRSLEKKFTEAT